MCKKLLEPSLLSIDKKNYLKQLKQIKALGIKYVHYDVMDGQFVPNTSFKIEFLKDIQKLGLKANVHLMVNEPKKWFKNYFMYKINSLGFHVESQPINESIDLLKLIHKKGFKAGIAIKMETDLKQYKDLLDYCDLITIMSVPPGKGGQEYSNKCRHNLKVCKKFKKTHPNLIIQIDGGVNDKIIKKNWKYVDWFVSGGWFFKNIETMPEIIKQLNFKQEV